MRDNLPLMRRALLLFVALAAACWLALCGMVWWMQDELTFPGAFRPAGPLGLPAGVEQVELRTEDGRPFRAAHRAPNKVHGVLAWYVGNGESLRSCANWALQLSGYGLEVVSPEYPGYGASPGRPSVDTILANARATIAWARARAEQLGVPLYAGGTSLGTFSAVHVASAGGVDRVLLLAPPTSIVAAGSFHYPWLPVGLLARHRFDSLSVAAQVQCPVLVVHGSDDRIVPLAHGRELAAAFPRGRLVVAEGRGHNDVQLQPSGPLGEDVRLHLLGESR